MRYKTGKKHTKRGYVYYKGGFWSGKEWKRHREKRTCRGKIPEE